MTEAVPSGKQTRAPQADGETGGSATLDSERAGETHPYEVLISWSGDGAGAGELRTASAGIAVSIGGARELGGRGRGANPEELLLGAVGACFVNTWAIFLKKLGVTYAEPSLRVTGELENDPAGGYRMRRATIHPRVPSSLLVEKRDEIAKTLQLAEKYCIISKVAKAAMSVDVVVEEV